MKHGKTYTCKRSKLMNYLVDLGFEPIEVRREFENPKYFNWIFENNDKLEKALDEYFNK